MERESQNAEKCLVAIPACPLYSVSTDGEVRRDVGGKGTRPGLLRAKMDKDGYRSVWLYPIRRTLRIHGIVLTAFVGIRPDGHEANHKNGDRADNRLANLEWLSHGDNVRHTYANGRGVQQKPGYRHPRKGKKGGWK